MAIYHCSISNVSRAKGGSACASLAYISGEKIHDKRSGKTFSYARRERVVETGTLLPDGAPAEFADPATLFNGIEQYEKTENARTAKKIEIALPRELTLDQQKKVGRRVHKRHASKRGVSCQLCDTQRQERM